MRRAALLLVPLFLFACDREPVAPDISPALDAQGPPAESGRVIRTTDIAGWVIFDPRTGLALLLGTTPDDLCDGPPYVLDATDAQIVVLPNGRWIVLESSHLQAWVWASVDDVCVNAPIAMGEVTYRSTDNDYWAYLEEHNNQEAWGFTAHGVVALTAGGTAQLSAHRRILYDRIVSDKVNLR